MRNEENGEWESRQLCYPSEEGVEITDLDNPSYAASGSVAQNSEEAYVLEKIHATFR